MPSERGRQIRALSALSAATADRLFDLDSRANRSASTGGGGDVDGSDTGSTVAETEADFDSDLGEAGRRYLERLPAAERTAFGQFYTPPDIGALLAKWAIRSPDDRVLDPCCGAGAITVEAYERLVAFDGLTHEDALGRLAAVDVNELPLSLTALRLAGRAPDEPALPPSVYHADFFDLDPATKRCRLHRLGDAESLLTDDENGPEGDTEADAAGQTLGTFDATVANPPYLRQERFAADRDRYRSHLRAFGPDGTYPYYDGESALDGRCDLYCYFLTHATSFLRDGGRLAWIVPTKWLTADYGPSLQRFLFDHYRVEAVVGFRKRVFEGVLVDTVLLLMERCLDDVKRDVTETNFVRLNDAMAPDDVLRVVEREYGAEASNTVIHSRPEYRTVAVRQAHLRETLGEKRHHYLTAPALYTAVLDHDRTVPLGSVARISRGKKTGANPIFLLDADAVRRWGVESRFLRPAIKNVREVDGFEHTAADAVRWMIDLHGYVETVRTATPDSEACAEAVDSDDVSGVDAESNLERRTLDSLRAAGDDGVLAYLEWAGTQPARSNRSVERNDPWFDIGPLDRKTAPICCPQAMDTRRFCFRVDDDVVASNRFLLVDPVCDSDVLLGLLNASLSKIVVESHGRVTGGGAVNLSTSDLRTFRVVDPSALTADQRTAVAAGFDRLRCGDPAGLDAIDRVVLDVLAFDISVAEIQAVAEALKRARRASGERVDVLVRRLDDLEARLGAVDGERS